MTDSSPISNDYIRLLEDPKIQELHCLAKTYSNIIFNVDSIPDQINALCLINVKVTGKKVIKVKYLYLENVTFETDMNTLPCIKPNNPDFLPEIDEGSMKFVGVLFPFRAEIIVAPTLTVHEWILDFATPQYSPQLKHLCVKNILTFDEKIPRVDYMESDEMYDGASEVLFTCNLESLEVAEINERISRQIPNIKKLLLRK